MHHRIGRSIFAVSTLFHRSFVHLKIVGVFSHAWARKLIQHLAIIPSHADDFTGLRCRSPHLLKVAAQKLVLRLQNPTQASVAKLERSIFVHSWWSNFSKDSRFLVFFLLIYVVIHIYHLADWAESLEVQATVISCCWGFDWFCFSCRRWIHVGNVARTWASVRSTPRLRDKAACLAWAWVVEANIDSAAQSYDRWLSSWRCLWAPEFMA